MPCCIMCCRVVKGTTLDLYMRKHGVTTPVIQERQDEAFQAALTLWVEVISVSLCT